MVQLKDKSGLAGSIKGDAHLLRQRVYYEDTDFSGVVYHARYLHFLERGRSDYLRLLGVHHHALEDGLFGEPLFFVVRDMQLRFIKPARIDDVLTIETRISDLKGAQIAMAQQILSEGASLLRADLNVVVINKSGKPKRIPTALADQLRFTDRN